MSETPERIWAWWDDEYDVGLLNKHGDKRYTPNDAKEYVRADILQHQTNLIEQLFAVLEITEQTDEGRVFHPNIIRSSRALDAEKLKTIMAELKRTVTENNKSDG